MSTNVKFKNELKQSLEIAGIRYNDYNDAGGFMLIDNMSKYKFPVVIKFKLISDTNHANTAKVITVVNSQPVNLEKNETM